MGYVDSKVFGHQDLSHFTYCRFIRTAQYIKLNIVICVNVFVSTYYQKFFK